MTEIFRDLPAPIHPFRRAAVLRQVVVDRRADHHDYVRRVGDDRPEIRGWIWSPQRPTP